jgi:translocation and assembly module TamB
MATAASTKKAKRADAPAAATAPRRRWWRRTIVLVGVPALVWFAPVIVGFGPVLNSIVSLATRDFQGTITVGGASLGWISHINLHDIEVQDADGKSLASIPRVASDKTLFALLTSPSNLGTFRIDHPQVNLVLNEKDSNVEEAVKAWTEPDDPERPKIRKPIGVSVIVDQGTVTIDDTAAGRSWQIDNLALEITVPRDPGQELACAASGRVAPGEPAGEFALELRLSPERASDSSDAAKPRFGGKGEFALDAQGFSLELLEPLLRRASERGELSGILQAHVSGGWNTESTTSPRGELNGQISVTQLALAGPWAGDDRLRLAGISAPCALVREGNRLEIRRCEIQSDVGQLTCTGTIDDLASLDATWFKSLWNVLPHCEMQMQGSLDLARLSQVLPATLRVREGMQIEEGAVNVALASGPQNGQWSCSGRVETTRLLATEQGRQISWDHPLLVTVAAHDTPQGPVIEQLNGQSDFLKFEGSGTPDFFGLTANFELSRLAEELGQFLDLGQFQLAGDGWSRVTWKRGQDDFFEADAELQAMNFVLARPGRPAWTDAKLGVTAAARGRLAGREISQVDTARIEVVSATDDFTASLVSPVSNPGPTTPWPVEARLRGELSRWLARVEPWFVPPPGWEFSGQVDGISNVSYSQELLTIEKLQADLTQIHAWGPTLFLDEPRMRVLCTGSLAPTKNTLRIADASLTTTDVGGRVQDLTFVATSPTGIERIGQGDLQGNLATLYRWTHDPRQPAAVQMTGMMTCTLKADLTERSPGLDLNATIDNLSAVSSTGQSWRERQLRMIASATYDEPNDIVQLAHFEVNAEAVRLNAVGKVERWSQERILSLNGTTQYDLEKLSILLQPYLNSELKATGHESRSFSLAGPIGALARSNTTTGAREQELALLEGKMDLGWQSARVAGFDVGPANLQGTLSKGIFQIAPGNASLSGGTLTFGPIVRLSPGPAMLYLPNGPLLTNVHISQEMCQRWLMFAAPVLAGTTRVEGLFSVQMAGCQIPLAAPRTGEAAGQLLIHSIDLEPGPLIRELSAVLGTSGTVKLAQQSKVDFKMIQERVYHRGLELQFPEVMVRTYGSVGLDQTLAIMAEMNIPPKWLRDNALGDAIKNRPLKIPIAGTLDRPQLDKQAISDAMAQFVRDAANGAVRDGLQRGLDKLLAPINPK